MYSLHETSVIRKNFWTSFGQYMKPINSASGERVNWVNYKTGIRHLYFRMDVNNSLASVAVELRHPDTDEQKQYFEQLLQFKKILEQITGEEWQWQLHYCDEDGNTFSRIVTTFDKVNIFNTNDWPSIISFFKPRIIALDEFWTVVKEGFT